MFYSLFQLAIIILKGYFKNVIRGKERVKPYLFYIYLYSYYRLRFKEVIIMFKGFIYKLLILSDITLVVRNASTIYGLALLLVVYKLFFK